MYNVILVPLDGSRRAERILPHVEEVAMASKATVVFLQVIEALSVTAGGYETGIYFDQAAADRIFAEANLYLSTLAGEFREKGMATKTNVEYGPVVTTILDVAEREQAGLVAMASHGRTGVARAFYGSVAAGVLNQADRPLLVIRAGD